MTDRKPRGLAALSPERRREIASMGGKASTSRPFRDIPGMASQAGKKSLDTSAQHDNSKEKGGR